MACFIICKHYNFSLQIEERTWNRAFLLNNMCWGVMVAATFLFAKTKSTAYFVVMCSNTILRLGNSCRTAGRMSSIKDLSRSNMSIPGLLSSPCISNNMPSCIMKVFSREALYCCFSSETGLVVKAIELWWYVKRILNWRYLIMYHHISSRSSAENHFYPRYETLYWSDRYMFGIGSLARQTFQEVRSGNCDHSLDLRGAAGGYKGKTSAPMTCNSVCKFNRLVQEAILYDSGIAFAVESDPVPYGSAHSSPYASCHQSQETNCHHNWSTLMKSYRVKSLCPTFSSSQLLCQLRFSQHLLDTEKEAYNKTKFLWPFQHFAWIRILMRTPFRKEIFGGKDILGQQDQVQWHRTSNGCWLTAHTSLITIQQIMIAAL